MNERAPTPPDLELVRQSRGLSWKVAAVTAVAVLAGVVGLKVVERPPPAPDPAVALLPSPPSTPEVEPSVGPPPNQPPTAPPRPTPTPMPQIEPPPQISSRDLTFGEDAFALVARIDGRLYFDVLQEVSPGSFAGIFRLPFPSSQSSAYRFDFVQLWTHDQRVRNYVEIASWEVALPVLREGTNESGPVFRDSAAAKSRARAVPRAVKRGYSIVVDAESRYSYGVISVAIEFGGQRADQADQAASLLVDRDWPLRKDKDDLARLYRDLVDL